MDFENLHQILRSLYDEMMPLCSDIADLAEAIGSCSQTIGRIERGERNPSLEIAIRLAHYLKVPVEDIFQVED